MATPCRFDVILDGVGGDTEQWAMGLLKPWSGAKYVTLVTPLLDDTDSLGLLSGTFQAGLSLHNTAFQVNRRCKHSFHHLKARFKKYNKTTPRKTFQSAGGAAAFQDVPIFAVAGGLAAASVGG